MGLLDQPLPPIGGIVNGIDSLLPKAESVLQSVGNNFKAAGTPSHNKNNGAISNAVNAASESLFGIPARQYVSGLNPNSPNAEQTAEATTPYLLGQGEVKAVEPLANAGVDMAVNGAKAAGQDIAQGVNDAMATAKAQPGGLQAGFIGDTGEAGATTDATAGNYGRVPQQPTAQVRTGNPALDAVANDQAQGLKINQMAQPDNSVEFASPNGERFASPQPPGEFQAGNNIPNPATEEPTAGESAREVSSANPVTSTKPSSLLDKVVNFLKTPIGHVLEGAAAGGAGVYALNNAAGPLESAAAAADSYLLPKSKPGTGSTGGDTSTPQNVKLDAMPSDPIASGIIETPTQHTKTLNDLEGQMNQINDPNAAAAARAKYNQEVNSWNNQKPVYDSWNSFQTAYTYSQNVSNDIQNIPGGIQNTQLSYIAMKAKTDSNFAKLYGDIQNLAEATGVKIDPAQDLGSLSTSVNTSINKLGVSYNAQLKNSGLTPGRYSPQAANGGNGTNNAGTYQTGGNSVTAPTQPTQRLPVQGSWGMPGKDLPLPAIPNSSTGYTPIGY